MSTESAYIFTEPLNSKGVIVIMLKQLPDQRAVILGQYIIENKSTVRATAKKFGISKSTVHMDVQKENVLKCLNTAFLPSSALRHRTVILS